MEVGDGDGPTYRGFQGGPTYDDQESYMEDDDMPVNHRGHGPTATTTPCRGHAAPSFCGLGLGLLERAPLLAPSPLPSPSRASGAAEANRPAAAPPLLPSDPSEPLPSHLLPSDLLFSMEVSRSSFALFDCF